MRSEREQLEELLYRSLGVCVDEGALLPSEKTAGMGLLQRVLAQTWDEGYWLGINRHTGPGNPYRKEIE